jgi:hypothetical protein
LVRRHRDLALARRGNRAGIIPAQAVAALRYRPFVQEHAAFLDEGIQGVAEGVGFSLAEAYLLQLRAELAANPHPMPVGEDGDEYTTLAILPEATADGAPLIGQNAGRSAFYAEIGIVVEIVSDDAPAMREVAVQMVIGGEDTETWRSPSSPVAGAGCRAPTTLQDARGSTAWSRYEAVSCATASPCATTSYRE